MAMSYREYTEACMDSSEALTRGALSGVAATLSVGIPLGVVAGTAKGVFSVGQFSVLAYRQLRQQLGFSPVMAGLPVAAIMAAGAESTIAQEAIDTTIVTSRESYALGSSLGRRILRVSAAVVSPLLYGIHCLRCRGTGPSQQNTPASTQMNVPAESASSQQRVEQDSLLIDPALMQQINQLHETPNTANSVRLNIALTGQAAPDEQAVQALKQQLEAQLSEFLGREQLAEFEQQVLCKISLDLANLPVEVERQIYDHSNLVRFTRVKHVQDYDESVIHVPHSRNNVPLNQVKFSHRAQMLIERLILRAYELRASQLSPQAGMKCFVEALQNNLGWNRQRLPHWLTADTFNDFVSWLRASETVTSREPELLRLLASMPALIDVPCRVEGVLCDYVALESEQKEKATPDYLVQRQFEALRFLALEYGASYQQQLVQRLESRVGPRVC